LAKLAQDLRAKLTLSRHKLALAIALVSLAFGVFRWAGQGHSTFAGLAPEDRPAVHSVDVLVSVPTATLSPQEAADKLEAAADRLAQHYGSNFISLALEPVIARSHFDRFALWYLDPSVHEAARQRLDDESLQREAQSIAQSLLSPLGSAMAPTWRKDPTGLRNLVVARERVSEWLAPRCTDDSQPCTPVEVSVHGTLLRRKERLLLARLRIPEGIEQCQSELASIAAELGVRFDLGGLRADDVQRHSAPLRQSSALLFALFAAASFVFALHSRSARRLVFTLPLAALMLAAIAVLQPWLAVNDLPVLVLALVPLLAIIARPLNHARETALRVAPWFAPNLALFVVPDTTWYRAGLAAMLLVGAAAGLALLLRARFKLEEPRVNDSPDSNPKVAVQGTVRLDRKGAGRYTLWALLSTLVLGGSLMSPKLSSLYASYFDAPPSAATELIRRYFYDIDGEWFRTAKADSLNESLQSMAPIAADPLFAKLDLAHIDDPRLLFLSKSEHEAQRHFLESLDPQNRALALEEALRKAGLKPEAFGEFIALLRERHDPPRIDDDSDTAIRRWMTHARPSLDLRTPGDEDADQVLAQRVFLRSDASSDLLDDEAFTHGLLENWSQHGAESMHGTMAGVLRAHEKVPLRVVLAMLAAAFWLRLLHPSGLRMRSGWTDLLVAWTTVCVLALILRAFSVPLNLMTLPAFLMAFVLAHEGRGVWRSDPTTQPRVPWLSLGLFALIGCTLAVVRTGLSQNFKTHGEIAMISALVVALSWLLAANFERRGQAVIAWLATSLSKKSASGGSQP
jgi:hypothetical protein